MKNEAYPFLTETGADVLTRLEQSPASAAMLTDEVVTLSKGAAGSALQRFFMQSLVSFKGFAESERCGPPHMLYKLTKRGHAALAAHRAAVSVFNAAMKEEEP